MPTFSDVNLKYTDARNERLYTPDFLKEAFVDVENRSTEILKPDKYIVYGSKGSGKTALGAHLELTGQKHKNWFIKLEELDNFDFDAVRNAGGPTSFPRGVAAWKFLIGLRLLALMVNDQDLVTTNPALGVLVEDLKAFGVLPSLSVSSLAQQTLTGNFAASSRFLLNLSANFDTKKELVIKEPGQLADVIVLYLTQLRISNRKYVLILDGLDQVLRQGSETLRIIGELIGAAKTINETLFTSGIDGKVILLLRDDITRGISDPDLGKRLHDNGVFLDWYQGGPPFKTDLLSVIKRRAEIVGYSGEIDQIWHQWLPIHIYRRPSAIYIIERTRYLPRDLINFLNAAQALGITTTPLSERTVFTAEKTYSERLYIKLYDSTAGLLPNDVRENLSSIFTELGRFFRVENLDAALETRRLNNTIDGKSLAQVLFDTHWIGNYWRTTNEQDIYNFKCRSRSAGFTPKELCVLQLGLIKGLNINLSFTNKRR